jgi:hypothetical protein
MAGNHRQRQDSARAAASIRPTTERDTGQVATAYDELNTLFQDQLKRSAFFVPVAFHVHSPGSHDWGRSPGDKQANDRARFVGDAGASAFLDDLAKHFRIVCITDHLKMAMPDNSGKPANALATWKPCKQIRDEKAQFTGLLQSPLTDSNRRPPPYHPSPAGTNLPVRPTTVKRTM